MKGGLERESGGLWRGGGDWSHIRGEAVFKGGRGGFHLRVMVTGINRHRAVEMDEVVARKAEEEEEEEEEAEEEEAEVENSLQKVAPVHG